MVVSDARNEIGTSRSLDAVPRLLTLVEVAEALRVSPHTVRAWVRKERLHPVRICRRLLFDPRAIGQFIRDAGSRTNEDSSPLSDLDELDLLT
jgi:hypothetical protein